MTRENPAALDWTAIAPRYDRSIRWVVPCFDEILQVQSRVLGALRAPPHSPLILDLGAGTGITSALCARTYPGMNLVAVDHDAMMLRIAERSLGGLLRPGSTRYMLTGLTDCGLRSELLRHAEALGRTGFDIVVSSLAIHHLTHDDKLTVFRMIASVLSLGGVFLLTDICSLEDPHLDLCASRFNLEYIQQQFALAARGCGSPADSEALASQRDWWLRHYERDNRPCPLGPTPTCQGQLAMLREAGLHPAGVPFRFWQYAILLACRREESLLSG